MICSNCQHQFSFDFKFCPNCAEQIIINQPKIDKEVSIQESEVNNQEIIPSVETSHQNTLDISKRTQISFTFLIIGILLFVAAVRSYFVFDAKDFENLPGLSLRMIMSMATSLYLVLLGISADARRNELLRYFFIVVFIALNVLAYIENRDKHRKLWNSSYTTDQSSVALDNLISTHIPSEKSVYTDSSLCILNTMNDKSSLGLNVDFFHPCYWSETRTPNIIHSYVKELNDSSAEGELFTIEKMSFTPSKKQIDYLTSSQFCKSAAKQMGKIYLTSNKVNIDNFDGDETVLKQKSSKDATIYNLTNHIYCKSFVVTIILFTTSYNDQKAKELFKEKRKLFENILAKTKIHIYG